jgi:antitoxin CptB
MTGTTRSSDGLDARRKRLLFRCWHRGTREMDLIIGRFADAHLADLTDNELTELEQLLEMPDPDLYAALTSANGMPPAFAGAVFARMRAFRTWDVGQ